jgi:uncharacterized protein YjbI with pentapeptide repeats
MFGWDPLYHTDLDHSDSRFRNVNLRASEFNDVNLRDARFENVALTGARFRNVCLGNVAIADANLEGMTINGIRVTELLRVYAERSGADAEPGTPA